MRVTLAEAILGAKVLIPTLDGSAYLKVPPGTQTGDRRVMQGRGVQRAGARAAGHQYVHFEVQVAPGRPSTRLPRARPLLEPPSQCRHNSADAALTRLFTSERQVPKELSARGRELVEELSREEEPIADDERSLRTKS